MTLSYLGQAWGDPQRGSATAFTSCPPPTISTSFLRKHRGQEGTARRRSEALIWQGPGLSELCSWPAVLCKVEKMTRPALFPIWGDVKI